MNNKCKVYNERLHLGWWSTWGIIDLDDDLTYMAQEMRFEQEWVWMLNELKEIARINVHDVIGLHLCVYTHRHLICVLCK
jgi:hypothetical protein